MLASTMMLLPMLAGSVQAAQLEEGIQWDWSQPHRYFIQTQVQLPEMIWLAARMNKQARIDLFDLRLVTQCAPGEPLNRNKWEVNCRIEDIALSAEALPQEEGLVQPIVEELDERMTGAVVQLQIRGDGRMVNIDLEEVERVNRRFGRINENMRLILTRGFAGLDLPLPSGHEQGWYQHSSWIMRAPSSEGSAGSSEIVHRLIGESDNVVTIGTSGRAMIVPGEGHNKYDTRMGGEATFDRWTGRMLERSWTMAGGPTASSMIAQGTEGYPYLQQGHVVALSEGQSWDVGESLEIKAQGPSQSAIQQSFLGTDLSR